MNCFPCFGHRNKRANRDNESPPTQEDLMNKKSVPDGKNNAENKQGDNENVAAKTFTFRELAAATKNFRQDCLVGEGGFGRVYKGLLAGSGQVVAVKQLDRNGLQGNKEFLSEILSLSLLQHQNLVNLIGYCADGDQRLLVYEFMSGGSLENHIHENVAKKKPLDWFARMRIAYGAAQGLEYLHDQANPIIYRDLKPSNVLLDEELNPKLSDYGLAKLGPSGDSKFQVSSMVTYGYSAPEYTRSGEVTEKSDVYSFGVVLLELITGRKVIDTTRPTEEQNLVSWAQPIFRDPKRFPDMADPLLNKQFPEKDLNQVVAIAAMCLQEEPAVRPLISDVVTTLSFITRTPIESLGSVQDESIPISVPLPPASSPEKCRNESRSAIKYQNEDKESSNSESSDYEDSSNAKLPKRDSSNHLDICPSNDTTQEYGSDHIENSSDYEDSGSVDEDEGSEDEYEEIAKGSKKWESKSSRKSSRNSNCGRQISSGHRDSTRSRNESEYSSRGSSQRTNDRNLSLSYQSRSESSTKKLDGDATSLDHIDNTRFDYGSSSLSKSSKASSNGSQRFLDESASFGQKSSRGLHEARRMSLTKSSRGSLDEERNLHDRNSMEKSGDGSISSSMSSNGSFDGSETFMDDETFSIDHNSKRSLPPQEERILLDQNSSRKSHGGSVLLDHKESLESHDGSSSSSHRYSSKRFASEF